MKFILQVMLIMVLAFMAELFMPWWSIAIAAALGGIFLGGRVGRSFFAGFFGIFVLWSQSALLVQAETGSTLPAMVGQLLPGELDTGGVALIAGVVGGLVGAFASAAGDSLRSLLAPKKTT